VPSGTETPLDLFSLSAQIAAELAAGLSDTAAIRERYGISDAQWQAMKANPAFRNLLKDAVRTWRGDMNAGQRITKKSEIILEEALPVLDSIAHNAENAPLARIEAVKQMATLAGRTAKQEGASAGGGFVLNINISEDKKITVGQEVPALEHDANG
jgi:hypothetical protein